MVQFLPPSNQGPSKQQMWGQAFANGASSLARAYTENQQKKQQLIQQKENYNKTNQFAKQIYGEDFELPEDQDLQKIILSKGLENLQKSQQMQNKQDYLNKLFTGNVPEEKSRSSEEKTSEMLIGKSPEVSSMRKGFDPSKITDEDIIRATAIDPQMGNMLQKQKDVSLRENREREKFEEKKRLSSPEHKREQKLTEAQAQADVKYNNELQSAHKQHEIKKLSLDKLEQLNEKGVTGKPYEKLLEKTGLISLTSEGRREFAADVKNLITDIRSVLGSQFSSFEFQTILNAYPSADFSKEANRAIINNLKEFEDIRSKEFEFAQQVKKEYEGKIPSDYQSIVNKKLQEYAQNRLPEIKKNTLKVLNEQYGISKGNTLLLDPKGDPLSVPDEKVAEMLDMGASLP